ncbi:Peptidoglycan/LPS O-acetylase OafA/YrhL, contains acyltransferase and SGNH-hydrolase domains [Nocardioides terrae]|uniref:Peptidoglycan/LPS O-acetylase OafA/YrhL, contains acyltransferase and SGNH-hydrolase domains n=1 Tax=Nocardioides terrae TaxID=574651 RepID=A0A1I1IQS7_9ACTN|nr:acyltransferase family protein [Nocardioides terrae]SFC38585.1 Peptidoglycan/LPS O-acetylase OafA/YrhL, contains acyltransferase and SGNH-hydrolase domains [Nocardioides terrae]
MTAEAVMIRAPHDRGPVVEGKRKDIQALRAVAVVAVVLYHLWPGVMRGGFVGVDIFFVISGFLITTHLIGAPPARPADLARFWSRRVLRLLPAVVVVVLATVGAALLWMSPGQWERMAHEALSSTFYVENWRLIADTTDYLDAHRAPSPFQHFWSLSVEEQYYVGWPLLIGLLVVVARRWVTFAGLALVVAGSLVYSVLLTGERPDVAYFSTFTRIWELGIGSLLAVAYPVVRRALARAGARVAVLYAGAAAILASLLFIDASAPFPGATALVPTLGAAAVIAAGDPDHRLNPRWLVRARPVQFVGDVSYSMYLWHWPLIVMTPYVLGHGRRLPESVAIVVVSVVAAWLSTRFVENPVRRARFLAQHSGRILLGGVALSLVVVAAAAGVSARVAHEVEQSQERVDAALGSRSGCVGAAALDPRHHCPSDPELVTTPAFAKADITNGILGCLNWPPFKTTPISCELGKKQAPERKIALFGNSHAGQWVEALQRIARKHGWRVDTFVVGVCASTDVRRDIDTSTGTSSEECQRLQHSIVQRIAQGGYDGAILATMDRDPKATPQMYAGVLDQIATTTPVLVIRDTPAPMDQNNEPPDCVAAHEDDLDACGAPPEQWIGPDPLAAAARERGSDDVRVIDLNRFVCSKRCSAVVGGVIVFSDFNHLSKTFSRTLVPYLEPAVEKLVSPSSR